MRNFINRIYKRIDAVSIQIQLFILKLILNGGELIMAMFFAQRIILGKNTFAEVPAKLKDQVREILIESGLEHLVIEGSKE